MQSLDIITVSTWLVLGGEPKDEVDWEAYAKREKWSVMMSTFSIPPFDFSRVKKSTHTSSMGALLWMLTIGALRLGVFLRQHLSHGSHQALISWNILGQ